MGGFYQGKLGLSCEIQRQTHFSGEKSSPDPYCTVVGGYAVYV